jgi:hypothetical protein
VHAAENNTIQVALVGCGGRGTGAASQALSVKKGRQELKERIDAGEIGDLIATRGYRMGGWRGAGPKPYNISELMYQIQKFHSFIRARGGVYSGHEMAPGLDELTEDSPAPLQLAGDRYARPAPGLTVNREY